MSLRNIKKLQSPDAIIVTDDSESESAPRKAANNFELVSEESNLRNLLLTFNGRRGLLRCFPLAQGNIDNQLRLLYAFLE